MLGAQISVVTAGSRNGYRSDQRTLDSIPLISTT
jgi:hypothetical protein